MIYDDNYFCGLVWKAAPCLETTRIWQKK